MCRNYDDFIQSHLFDPMLFYHAQIPKRLIELVLKLMGSEQSKKKEDTHASSIVLQVAEQFGPVDAGPAGLNWPYATAQKSPGLTRRHTLLSLYLAMCTTRLSVWQGRKNRFCLRTPASVGRRPHQTTLYRIRR